jgi:TonB-dependent receptor
MRFIYTSSIILFAIISSFGQSPIVNGINQNYGKPGTIKGVLQDFKTKEAVIGATIRVDGTSLGAATGVDGEFVIEDVPEGNHTITISSVGYGTKKIENVTVESGSASVINTTVEETSTQLNEVVVSVTRLTSTDVSVIKDIKEARAVVSAISGIQISKTQDRDASDVVKRIPGVTIFDNRFVNVRGLNDRYNSVWLNDAASPSTEAEKKSFSFDIIPTAVIDRVLVYKSPSPELPGDFAGGMVKIYTRTSLPSNNWIVTFSQGYRSGSTFRDFNYNTKGSTDFLGYDDGQRSIPFADKISTNQIDQYAAATAFKNTWGINRTKANTDLRFGLTKGSKFNFLGKTIESVSLINYSNTSTVFNIARKDYDPDINYLDNQSTNQVRLGAMQNLGIRLNDKHKFEWRNFFNQIGTDQTTVRQGRVLHPYENSYSESYQSRYVISSQLSGKHRFNDKLEYTWTGGYSKTNRNDPDLKRLGYTQDPNGLKYSTLVPPGSVDTRYGGRFYQKLNENVYSFTHNLLKKFDIGTRRVDVSIGTYFETKSRNFSARSLGYILIPGSSNSRGDGLTDLELKQLPIDQIFSSNYVGPGGFAMNEITNGSDSYHAENKLTAAYVSLSVPVTDKLKLLGGLRAEHNIQSLVSEVNNQKISPKVDRLNFLPSANLSYNFNKQSLIRATYGKSLNRPEFREWAPFVFYNFDLNVNVYGSLFPTVLNPGGKALETATVDNFDLRYELYPSAQELFHVGVYYKNFKNPIEQYLLPNRTFTFSNANAAYAAGIEVDFKKNLGFIGGRLFEDMDIVANASIIKSEIHVTNGSANTIEKRPLQGQSPYVINAGFYYHNDERGITGSLTYNVFGPRLFLVGDKTYGSWGELPRNTVDIAINYPISQKIAFTIAIQDILNQPVQLVQDTNGDGKYERDGKTDLTIQKFRRGQYFNVGLKLTL